MTAVPGVRAGVNVPAREGTGGGHEFTSLGLVENAALLVLIKEKIGGGGRAPVPQVLGGLLDPSSAWRDEDTTHTRGARSWGPCADSSALLSSISTRPGWLPPAPRLHRPGRPLRPPQRGCSPRPRGPPLPYRGRLGRVRARCYQLFINRAGPVPGREPPTATASPSRHAAEPGPVPAPRQRPVPGPGVTRGKRCGDPAALPGCGGGGRPAAPLRASRGARPGYGGPVSRPSAPRRPPRAAPAAGGSPGTRGCGRARGHPGVVALPPGWR